MKILITGFEPFNNNQINPSMLVLEKLKNKYNACLLPVSYKNTPLILANKIDEIKPDLIILLGLADNRANISLELIGINYIGANIPDNDNLLIKGQIYHPNLPDGLITNNTTIHRMNSIWYILLIFATFGIYEVYKEIKKKDIFLSILAIIYAILFVSFTTYFNVYYKYGISSDICFSRGFYQTLNYLETSDKKVAYYDNAGMDIARKEEYYIEVNNDENIEYIPLNTKKEIEEKLENIKDNEIIIINANRWNKDIRFAKKQIGSYAIIYK